MNKNCYALTSAELALATVIILYLKKRYFIKYIRPDKVSTGPFKNIKQLIKTQSNLNSEKYN